MGYGQSDACDGVDACSDDTWKIFGGYRINENLGIEASYYHFLELDEFYDGYYYTPEIKISGIAIAGTLAQPISDNLEVFGKLGALYWEAEADGNTIADETDVLAGLGASYQITDNIGLRGEYEYIGGDVDTNIYTVGATLSSW